VELLLADFTAGKLAAPQADRAALSALLAERQADLVDRAGWRAIDQAEKTAGKSAGRPRVKFTTREDLLKAARG
jgi:ferredoxin--NADP+ reductase